MADNGKRLESYSDKPINYSSRADHRQADRKATIDDVTSYIYQSLIDYQGKWEKSDAHEWAYRFPYARYLSEGDVIQNRSTTPDVPYTIEEIIDKATNTVRLSGSTKPVTGNRLELSDPNMVNFISAYPYEHIDREIWRDTITYKVARREPGTVSAHPFDGRKEIKPRTRQILVDPDYPGYHITVLGQWFDNEVQFEFWTKFANDGDTLITWFEDFLYKYTWVFKKNGVQEMLYLRREIDEEITKWRNDLCYRSLSYYFRTEKLVPVRDKDFTQVDVIVNLESDVFPAASGSVVASGTLLINDGGLT